MRDEDVYRRIERMEDKLDKLVTAVTELVKIDANLVNLTARMNAHSISIDLLDKRIDVLEQKAPMYDLVMKVVWGGVGLILTAVIVGILALVITGGN